MASKKNLSILCYPTTVVHHARLTSYNDSEYNDVYTTTIALWLN